MAMIIVMQLPIMIKMWTTMDFARPLSCSKFKPSNSSCRQQKSFWLWILCWWSHSWNDTYKWKNVLGGDFQIYVTLAFVQFLPQRLRHAGCNLYWTAFLKRPDLERCYVERISLKIQTGINCVLPLIEKVLQYPSSFVQTSTINEGHHLPSTWK